MQNEQPLAKSKSGRKQGRQAGKVYCSALKDTCMNFPCRGRRTCRMHGGTAKVGADSPSYRGRGHSKYLPKRLGARLDEALLDADFLSQRRAIAQMSAHIEELWDRLTTADPPKKERRNWNEFLRAVDQSRKLIESERRREIETQEFIAFSQVAVLIDSYTATVRQYVTDPVVLRQISAGFLQLVGQTPIVPDVSSGAADGVAAGL